MDALTNVVAVLILVLILVQADVSQKVVKFIEEMIPATPEEIAKAKEEFDQASKRIKSLESMLKAAPPSAELIELSKQEIAALRAQITAADQQLLAVKESQQQELKLRKELEDQVQATDKIEAQVENLEKQLANLKVPEATPPVEVTIPDSRPVPENAVVFRAICVENKIHIIDVQDAMQIFMKEFERNKNGWIHERKKRNKASDLIIYDQTKIAAHFEKNKLKTRTGQPIAVMTNPEQFSIWLEITPDLKAGGTSLEALDQKGSEFYNSAIRIRGSIKNVLIYHVQSNAFETYLKARELSDRANISAGWEVGTSGKWRELVPDIRVNRLREPTPSTTPQPKKPPALDNKLD